MVFLLSLFTSLGFPPTWSGKELEAKSLMEEWLSGVYGWVSRHCSVDVTKKKKGEDVVYLKL